MDEIDYVDKFCHTYEKSYLWLITRFKLYYQRGMSYASIPFQIISLFTFLKVWETTFAFFGISKIIMYLIFPIILIVGCGIIGWYDERKGMWANESLIVSQKVSPLTRDTYNVMKNMERMIEELQKEIKELKNK